MIYTCPPGFAHAHWASLLTSLRASPHVVAVHFCSLRSAVSCIPPLETQQQKKKSNVN